MQNILQPLLDKMFEMINSNETTSSELSKIFMKALEFRDGLLENYNTTSDENISWVNVSILKFTEIMVRSNHKAHRILNAKFNCIPESCEDEVIEELKKIQLKLVKK